MGRGWPSGWQSGVCGSSEEGHGGTQTLRDEGLVLLRISAMHGVGCPPRHIITKDRSRGPHTRNQQGGCCGGSVPLEGPQWCLAATLPSRTPAQTQSGSLQVVGSCSPCLGTAIPKRKRVNSHIWWMRPRNSGAP